MVGIFFFAACLHPKEFTNIIHGVVFFLMIPSTYVFLTLYSLINLNVITWGTREAVAKATGQKTKKAPMEQFIDRVIDIVKKGFRLISCREKKEHEERREKMEKKMQRMELALRSIEVIFNFRNVKLIIYFQSGADVKKILDATEEKEKREEETQTADFPIEENVEKTQKEIQKANRYVWMTSHSLKVCERGKLKSAEKVFWNELINAYLKPIKTTPAEMKAVAEGLASLRNQIAFTILLVNSLLALAIFLIQKHKNVLSIKFSPISKQYYLYGQFKKFVFFF